MNKKIVIIIVVGILLVAVIGILIFLNNKNSLPGIIPGTTTSQEIKTTFGPFSLAYPSDWIAGRVSFPGGESFFVRPGANSTNDYLPSFIIERHSGEISAQLEQKKNLLKAFGLKEGTSTVNNETVVQLKGAFLASVSLGESYYDVVDFYPYKGDTYVIEYKYKGVQKDPVMEQLFLTILSSMKVN